MIQIVIYREEEDLIEIGGIVSYLLRYFSERDRILMEIIEDLDIFFHLWIFGKVRAIARCPHLTVRKRGGKGK